MINASLNLTSIFVVFLTCINAVAVAAALSTNLTNLGKIQHDFVEGMVHETITDNNVLPLLGKRRNDGHNDGVRKKSSCIEYDHECARKCVNDDWMGMNPRFPDRSFKQTLRIKRSMVDEIICNLAKSDSFWHQMVCHAGKPMMSYEISGNAFIHHFQMSKTTSRRCLSCLTRGIVCCSALADAYLRKPTKSDARIIVALYERVHNISGMMGSLDLTKAHWKNCPTAWKGQFQGHEKFTRIGLKAFVDTNL
jgi:hypothetical protein